MFIGSFLSLLESNLRTLHLGNNQLITLCNNFDSLNNLRYLSLGENKLTQIPESLGKLNSLKSLNLKGNPLSLPKFILSIPKPLQPLDQQGCIISL